MLNISNLTFDAVGIAYCITVLGLNGFGKLFSKVKS
jgi:hypothetical protein